jgi:hypothetical protein
MAKVLAVASDIKRLSEVNNLLRAQGHMVRGADCRSTMRHLLSAEPFQFIVVLEKLPPTFADALREELHAGRRSPRVIWAEGVEVSDINDLIAGPDARRARAA